MPSGINIIKADYMEDPFCKICINTKLILYDMDELVYKCRLCGSLFKYTKPIKKAQLGIDPELDNIGTGKLLFYKENKKAESIRKLLPEIKGNVQLKQVRDIKYEKNKKSIYT